MSDVQQRIHSTVTKQPRRPLHEGRCALSAVRLFGNCRADPQGLRRDDFVTVNVLADEEIRNGIKEYANWPTIPQLYINGEFVGGCDIMKEMYQAGELQKMLEGIAQV
jgi:monothiol glutaredoxin